MSDDVKKYTSLYDIKDYALNVLAPKYFRFHDNCYGRRI